MPKILGLFACTVTIMICFSARAQTSDFSDAATAPPALLKVAKEQMTKMKGISDSEILRAYKIVWTYEAWYDDDEPVDFFFTSASETCLIAVGSQSMEVRENYCQSHTDNIITFHVSITTARIWSKL